MGAGRKNPLVQFIESTSLVMGHQPIEAPLRDLSGCYFFALQSEDGAL